MIAVKLQGGLGNQMFQYSAARALAERRKTQVLLDLTWFGKEIDSMTTLRRYELNCYMLDIFTEKFVSIARQRLQLQFAKKYTEPYFHYDAGFLDLPKNTVLSGYFQSEKYFADIRRILLKEFSWINEPRGKNKDLMKQIATDVSSISLHVRRGDYVSNKYAAKFHGLTEMDYYRAAVEKMVKKVKSPNFYIFSDDPEWCKKNMKFIQPTTYVSHNIDGSEDLQLMVACRHNIIANSSFSWWGAWLNQNPGKYVIAPKQWFSHSENITKDIIPKSWQKI